MRKITKQPVPASLNSLKTQQLVNKLIEEGKWINENNYLNCYKQPDVRAALEKSYNYKCAYCEQKVNAYHIDHFRPKSKYYWLAYSWDNLMLCCPNCNCKKSNKFDVLQQANITTMILTDIHIFTIKYNEYEQNKLINPETEDIQDKIAFTKTGKIRSKCSDRHLSERIKYTIKTCDLNDPILVMFRKTIFDTIEKEIISRKNNKEELKKRIKEFKTQTKKALTEFTLFRKKYIEDVFFKQILVEN